MAWEKEKAAHAAGKRIQFLDDGIWQNCFIAPVWSTDTEYRIHPDDEVHSTDDKSAIPHADIIKAILDGKTVQLRWTADAAHKWLDYDSRTAIGWMMSPNNGHVEFRVKPEPVIKWAPIFKEGHLLAARGVRYCTLFSGETPTQWLRLEFIDGKCVSVTLEDV